MVPKTSIPPPVTTFVTLGHDSQDQKTAFHVWKNNGNKETASGTVIVYHGFRAHGLYPTVRYVAELLAAAGYTAYAADLPGHGQSEGVEGYLPSAEGVIKWGGAVARHVLNVKGDSAGPLFMVGSSMGGTIALCVAQDLASSSSINVTGVVLLAPMLHLKVSDMEKTLLSGLAWIVPTLSIIPSSSTSSAKQYRDPQRRKECDDDPHTSSSSTIRCGSAYTCTTLCDLVQQQFGRLTVPYLLLVADEDVVVSNVGAERLFQESPPTSKKRMERYPALHGLLCEPEPLRTKVEQCVIQWVESMATSKAEES